MKLLSVVCRVEDELGEHLHNIEPATFLDLLSSAVESNEPPDELAELQAELDAAKKHSTPATANNAIPEGSAFNSNGDVLPATKNVAGMVVLPRAAAEPIVTAKTRGEVYEQLDVLLSQFGARLAKEGE